MKIKAKTFNCPSTRTIVIVSIQTHQITGLGDIGTCSQSDYQCNIENDCIYGMGQQCPLHRLNTGELGR